MIHTNENITVEGFDGKIDVLGGDWQNAVYKITLNEEEASVDDKFVDTETCGPQFVEELHMPVAYLVVLHEVRATRF